ncbi:hypothetical protein ACL9RI_12245 [Janthinobacterium sp. Mn2066]|uniref:hypothetical protein n=1 Tax=Janthinobacterium sp. Mn2066 TaxID=3395264 RepID=UPI003BBB2D2A
MKRTNFFLLLVSIFSAATATPAVRAQEHLPQEICKELNIQPCSVRSVDAFSEVDLNSDAKKEIIFAYSGGSCGEQHWVYVQKGKKWIGIASWCGMDGGAYRVLSSKHNGYFDIDTNFGVIRFNGKIYSNTTRQN